MGSTIRILCIIIKKYTLILNEKNINLQNVNLNIVYTKKTKKMMKIKIFER